VAGAARVFLDTPLLHAIMVLVVERASCEGGAPAGEARKHGDAREMVGGLSAVHGRAPRADARAARVYRRGRTATHAPSAAREAARPAASHNRGARRISGSPGVRLEIVERDLRLKSHGKPRTLKCR